MSKNIVGIWYICIYCTGLKRINAELLDIVVIFCVDIFSNIALICTHLRTTVRGHFSREHSHSVVSELEQQLSRPWTQSLDNPRSTSTQSDLWKSLTWYFYILCDGQSLGSEHRLVPYYILRSSCHHHHHHHHQCMLTAERVLVFYVIWSLSDFTVRLCRDTLTVVLLAGL